MNARAANVSTRTSMSDCLHKYLGLNQRKVKSRSNSCIVADTVTRWRKATFETLCNSGDVNKGVRKPRRALMNGQHDMDTGGIEQPFRSQQRISKIIALREFCSRREAERLISRSQVVVNGVLIHQGSKAECDSEIQLAEIGDQVWFQSKSTVALNKPRGYVSNLPSHGEVEACSLLITTAGSHIHSSKWSSRTENDNGQLNVCGRLDKNSRGLLVLSQDGVLAREVIAGVFVSKTYLVEVDKMVTQNDLDRLNGPCKFLTDVIRPIRVRLLAPTLLEFVLREGKNRQIRRMCEQLGLIVVDLFRVRLGKSELGSLPEGSWRTMPTVEGDALKIP